MGPKSWLLSEHLAACSCLVITANLSEYHHCTLYHQIGELRGFVYMFSRMIVVAASVVTCVLNVTSMT
jgi:hypothetical protein